MAYRQGKRYQMMMFPPTIEDFVPEDHPARVYDAFVEGLAFEKLDFKINGFDKVGNPEYDPKSLLKIILFGYSYGERSSRRLERCVHDNTIFMWLACGLKPDHATIARFRQRNKKLLKKIFKQCAQLCIKLKLIEGNTLFVDGTKIRANAGIKNTVTKTHLKEQLKNIESRINTILKECDKADAKEAHMGSFVKLREELNSIEKIRTSVKKALAEIDQENSDDINLTDPDCKKMKGRQGTHSGYNAQVVVDEKYGLIVSNDVVNDANDLNQFSKQINTANKILEKNCENACGDAGYSNVCDLKNSVNQGINVVVPNQKQAEYHKKEDTGFEKEYFKYDKEKDEYMCPEGKRLIYKRTEAQQNNRKVYLIENSLICKKCVHFDKCTKCKRGREIKRHTDESLKEKLAEIYLKKQGQVIYKKRKEKIELVFGHIKHNLKVNSFLLRRFDGVKSEMAVLSTVFNIRRMITLLGTTKLIEAMALLNDPDTVLFVFSRYIIGAPINFMRHFFIKLFTGYRINSAMTTELKMINVFG